MSNPKIILSIRKLFSLLTRQEKVKWAGIVGFALCASAFEVMVASVIVVFAQVLNQPEIGEKYMTKFGLGGGMSPTQTILYMALAFGLIYLVKNVIAIAEVFYQNMSIQKMSYNFKNRLLYRFAESDYNYSLTRNSSYGLAVVGGDAELTFSGGMLSLSAIISETVVFTCLILMVVYLNPFLAFFISGIGLAIGLLVSKGLFPLFYHWGQRLQESSLLANQNLIQFFHGFKELILLGKKDSFIEAFKVHSRKKARVQAIQTATNALPRITIEVLFVGLFVATISYLCLERDTPQQMIGILGGYLYVGFRLMPGLNRIIAQLNTFKYNIPSIERVYKEFTSDLTRATYEDVPNLTFKKGISFKNVTFHYLNTNKNIMENVDLLIKKGECIGIVGETGSGKSTMIDLLLGLLKPSDGEIKIDGKYPVNSYQWHKMIGYVPQSLYLTDDTIEANIAFGVSPDVIDQKQLNKSIDDAQLRSFINKLPDGAKTIVGERGVRLSGGERQRISIARALYRNPEVLIFDEATSALDNETEGKVMETIRAVSHDRTVIMIAHRLTTLKDCDRILRMVNGKAEGVENNKNLKSVKVESHVLY